MSVIDASVYIAIHNDNDIWHDIGIKWMINTRTEGEKVFAPNILLAEACAAISRTTDTSKAEVLLKRLQNSKVITLIPITESLAIRAAEIGLQNKIRGCDAIYVAVAEQLGQKLITLDNQQRERAKAVVEAQTPQEWLDDLASRDENEE